MYFFTLKVIDLWRIAIGNSDVVVQSIHYTFVTRLQLLARRDKPKIVIDIHWIHGKVLFYSIMVNECMEAWNILTSCARWEGRKNKGHHGMSPTKSYNLDVLLMCLIYFEVCFELQIQWTLEIHFLLPLSSEPRYEVSENSQPLCGYAKMQLEPVRQHLTMYRVDHCRVGLEHMACH